MKTLSEIERHAYADGNFQILSVLQAAGDEMEMQSYEAEEVARKEGYDEGYKEGEKESLDRDLLDELDAVKNLIAKHEATIRMLTGTVKHVEKALTGDACKTVANRKILERKLHIMRMAHGLHVGD